MAHGTRLLFSGVLQRTERENVSLRDQGVKRGGSWGKVVDRSEIARAKDKACMKKTGKETKNHAPNALSAGVRARE